MMRKKNNKTKRTRARITPNTEGLKENEDRNQTIICRKDNFVIRFD